MGQNASHAHEVVSESSSWRESAGRNAGPDSYIFGDISRSALRTFSTGIDWKSASGRSAGSSEYKFGDITRSGWQRFSTCVDWRAHSGRTGGEREYQFGDIMRSIVSAVKTCASQERETFDGDISEVWMLFFIQCEECGSGALAKGLISDDDVASQEPYLFLGLPGLCMLECILRSSGPNISPTALLLTDGREILASDVPTEDGAPELFAAMLYAKRVISEANLDQGRLKRLKRAVLRAEGDEAGDAELARIASIFQRIATDISQLSFFRRNFLNVLEALSSRK